MLHRPAGISIPDDGTPSFCVVVVCPRAASEETWTHAADLIREVYDVPIQIVLVAIEALYMMTEDGVASVCRSRIKHLKLLGIIATPGVSTWTSRHRRLDGGGTLHEHAVCHGKAALARIVNDTVQLIRCIGALRFTMTCGAPWMLCLPHEMDDACGDVLSWSQCRLDLSRFDGTVLRADRTDATMMVWHTQSVSVNIQHHLWSQDYPASSVAFPAAVLDSFWQRWPNGASAV
eukprot:Skav217937  [mRNA]  locus=scaffold1737:106710:107408:+ [translate_table: standard]